MTVPEIILITLWSIGLLMTAYMHGKPKETNHNIFASLTATAINIALLMWAGLFIH